MRSNIQVIGVIMMAFLVNGCASTTAHRQASMPVNDGAQAFVDTQMSQTLSSIDNSLKTLLILDRGGEGPRKPGPIGTTVAGAAGPMRQPIQPVSGSRVVYSESVQTAYAAPYRTPYQAPYRAPRASYSQDDAQARPAVHSSQATILVADGILSKRAKIQWYGSASQLLSTLARSVGYRYEEVGNGTTPNVRIPNQEMTIRELLSRTASQIEAQADIRVDTVARRIQLIRH